MTLPGSTLNERVGSKPGATMGAFALLDLHDSDALRIRLDYGQWRRAQADGPTSKVTCWSLGAEYFRLLSGSVDQGPYAVAGLGLSSNLHDQALRTSAGAAIPAQRSNLPYCNVALGYQLVSAFGLEAGYRWTSLPLLTEALTPAKKHETIGFLTLAATFRF